jgi:hypothetical protein
MTRKREGIWWGLIGFVLWLSQGCNSLEITEQPLVSDTFDLDNQGWRVTGNGTDSLPVYRSTGGNPGGYIDVIDKVPGNWYFTAPYRVINRVKGGSGHRLYYELKQAQLDQQVNSPDVILRGGNLTLHYNTSYHPGQNWTAYAIDMDASKGWYKKNNQPASQAELTRVLNSLDQLLIRGEFRAGPDEGGLDNVVFKE